MTPIPTQPDRRPPRVVLPIVIGVVATAGAVGGMAGLLAWQIARESAAAGVDPTMKFVAFAFAVMGLAWLAGLFFLARPGWPGLFRWAAAVDAAGIALLLGAVRSDAVTWREGLALYLILASFAVLQLAAAWLTWRVGLAIAARPGKRVLPSRGVAIAASTPAAHGPAALVGVMLMAVACTSLVWGHLPDRLTGTPSRADVAIRWVVRYVNPLLAANDAINPPTSFGWAHHGNMYAHYGIIGESRLLGLPNWLVACGFYLLTAAVLAAVGYFLPRRRCPPTRSPSCRS